jgi:hypothetical protein
MQLALAALHWGVGQRIGDRLMGNIERPSSVGG